MSDRKHNCPQCGFGPLELSMDLKRGEGHYCPFCNSFYPVEPMQTMRVPDQLGYITGWRAWYVTDTPEGKMITSQRFGGAQANDMWLPGQTLTARCTQRPDVQKKMHLDADATIPYDHCKCGFYSARSREHLLSLNNYHRYDRTGKPTVIGLVHMWGKVRVATLGWRAQYVKAAEIYVPYEMWQLANDLQHYEDAGVAVRLDNTLVAPTTNSPRWCRSCGMRIAERAIWCECGQLAEA